jgi:glycosyltransferase involved in cell wall biosynthesis
MGKITYCIPSKNNLRYLKSSIKSIKENSSQEFDIIVFIDSDNDGTKEWLDREEIKYITNESNIPKGIAYGYNRCIKAATTPIVCMFHADMFMGKGFDTAIYTVADEAGKVEGLEKLYGTIFKPTTEEQSRMLQLHADLLVEQIANQISKP